MAALNHHHRKKDIIVTAGQEYRAAEPRERPRVTLVSQATSSRPAPYPAAFHHARPGRDRQAADRVEGDLATLAREPRVVELVSDIVEDVNRERSRFEQVKRFVILPRDFEMEQGEVTPTLKLKRRVVLENFADEVEGLYLSAGSESAGADPDRGDPAPAARANP
jgi:long-chain acyl-CoA synthetase